MKKITFLFLVLTMTLAGCGGIKELDRSRTPEPGSEQERIYAAFPLEMPDMAKMATTGTPRGVQVYSQDPIPVEHRAVQFAAIDSAVERGLQATAKKNWTVIRNHNEVAVVMIRPQYTSVVDGAGLLKMRNGVTTAGTVLCMPSGSGESCFIVIAQNWNYPQMTRNATKNEWEHLAAKYNDESVFNSFLGVNDSHPNFPLPDDNEWYSAPVN